MRKPQLVSTLILSSFFAAAPVVGSAAEDCDAKKMQEILEKGTSEDNVRVSCNLTLQKNQRITKRVVLMGSAASGVTIDCNGGEIGSTGNKEQILRITSRRNDGNSPVTWDRPENITIKNCTFNGPVRVMGMGSNGQGEYLKDSSRKEGHTARAQANAPTQISFTNSKFVVNGDGIPLYISPGVTRVSVFESAFEGKGVIAVYMDAESAENRIVNNRFDMSTERREVMAIDGSANNEIVGNKFSGLHNGGIFLYRNCGEGGNIRHQAPQGNKILNNFFYYDKYDGPKPAIYVGSRGEGSKRYCHHDAGYPFGSSADDGDQAYNNIVSQNRIRRRNVDQMILVADPDKNTVFANETVEERE